MFRKPPHRKMKVIVTHSEAWLVPVDPCKRVLTVVGRFDIDLSELVDDDDGGDVVAPTDCSEVLPNNEPNFPLDVDGAHVAKVASYAANETHDAFLTAARQPDKFQRAVSGEPDLQYALGSDLSPAEVAYCAGWLELAQTFYPTNDALRKALGHYGDSGPTL